MFQQFDYKTRNYAILGFFCLVLLLFARVHLPRTIGQWKLYQLNQTKLQDLEGAVEEKERLREALSSYTDGAYEVYNQKNVLEAVSDFCSKHKLLVSSFAQPSTYSAGNTEVLLNKIEVEGGFKDVLSLVYFMEQEVKLASVASLGVSMQRKRGTQINRLISEITLQSIQNKDEK